MTKTPQNDIIAGPQAVDLADGTGDTPITEVTAATLRELCNRTGEEFDGNLTEEQARARIAALEEAHGVSATG